MSPFLLTTTRKNNCYSVFDSQNSAKVYRNAKRDTAVNLMHENNCCQVMRKKNTPFYDYKSTKYNVLLCVYVNAIMLNDHFALHDFNPACPLAHMPFSPAFRSFWRFVRSRQFLSRLLSINLCYI